MNWDVFAGKESENNWLRRDEALQQLILELEGGTFSVPLWRVHIYNVLQVLHTARTQLALTACKFVAALARHLPSDERDAFTDILVSNLLRVCAGTKKLVAGMGQEALEIVFAVSPASKVLAAALQTMHDKNTVLRQRVLEALLSALRDNAARWLPRHWGECETLLTRAVGDASPVVRAAAVELLAIAQRQCGAKAVAAMMNKLDLSTAKQLKQLVSKQARPAAAAESVMTPGSADDQAAVAITVAGAVVAAQAAVKSASLGTDPLIKCVPQSMLRPMAHEMDTTTLQSDADANHETPSITFHDDAQGSNPFIMGSPEKPVSRQVEPSAPVERAHTPSISTHSGEFAAVGSLVTIGQQQSYTTNAMEVDEEKYDDETDDEVIIPMQRISISGGSNAQAETTPSRIPRRSPSAAKIALCTPYRHFIRHYREEEGGTAVSPLPASPSRISVDSLVEQIRGAGAVPIATWKKLALIAEAQHAQLTPVRVGAALEAVHARLASLASEDLGSVGVLTRHLMALADEYLELTPAVLELLLVLDERYADFSPLWEAPPIEWVSMTRERIAFIVDYAQGSSGAFAAHALEALHHIYVQQTPDDDVLAECLPTLNAIWVHTRDTAVKKAVVACVTTARRRLGDSLFFQILPLLTVSQRRLLDAFMSMDA